MLGNALIGLREGLEASLVVSILVAFLVKTDRRDELPRVWLGVGVAVAVSVGVTLALTLTQQALTFEAQEALGGSLSIIAVGFVTWMIFWMRRNARTLSSDLRGRLDEAIRMGPVAVVAMAALAVGREGLETAVFFFAAAQAAGQTTEPLIGFLIGIAVAIGLAYLLYRGAGGEQCRDGPAGHGSPRSGGGVTQWWWRVPSRRVGVRDAGTASGRRRRRPSRRWPRAPSSAGRS